MPICQQHGGNRAAIGALQGGMPHNFRDNQEVVRGPQLATLPTLKIPKDLYEPGLETWLDAITDESRSWVHIPREKPDIFD